MTSEDLAEWLGPDWRSVPVGGGEVVVEHSVGGHTFQIAVLDDTVLLRSKYELGAVPLGDGRTAQISDRQFDLMKSLPKDWEPSTVALELLREAQARLLKSLAHVELVIEHWHKALMARSESDDGAEGGASND